MTPGGSGDILRRFSHTKNTRKKKEESDKSVLTILEGVRSRAVMAGLALAALGAALALLSPPVVCHRAEVPEGQPLQLHHGCEKHHGVLHRD